MQCKAYPHVRKLFAPRQVRLADVPKLAFNISDAASQLTATSKVRLHRARLIAPELLGGRKIPVPVCPLPNPLTGASHHSLVLSYPEDKSLKVQLFFDDTNLYFEGFCRCKVTMTDDGPQEEWGRCFVFNDKYRKMPAFFRPVKMGLDSSHSGKGDAPGPVAMLEMFYTLANFEDVVEVDDSGTPSVIELSAQLERELQMAVGRAIVVFCEALRLKMIYHEVQRSLRGYGHSRVLNGAMWKLIRSWGKLSEESQFMRKRHQQALTTDLDCSHDISSRGFNASKLGDIIGPHGQLKLAKLEVEKVITQDNIQIWEADRDAVYLTDPSFQTEELAGGEGEGRGRGQPEELPGGRGGGEGRGRGGRGRGRGQPEELPGRGRGGRGRGGRQA